MGEMRIAIILMISLLTCYTTNKLVCCFLVSNTFVKKRIFYLTVVAIIYGITFYYEMNLGTILACYLICTLLLEIGLSGDLQQKLLCLIYVLFLTFCIQITATIFIGINHTFFSANDTLLSRQLIICAMQYLEMLMISRTVQFHTEIMLPKIYWFLMILVPICSMYFISLLMQSQTLSKLQLMTGVVGIIIVDDAIMILYQALTNVYRQLLEKRIEEEQSRYYKKQLEYVTESYQTVRAVKHDIKNILNSVKNMIVEEKYQEIITYIDTVNHSAGFNTKYIETGNTAIDGILNYQIPKAQNARINVSCKINVPQRLAVDELDMCIILGNLLDNAVEATELISLEEPKEIQVVMNLKKDNLFLNIVNPYNGQLIKGHDGRLRSSKKEGTEMNRMHGVGLENVKRVVNKYHGQLICNYDQNLFHTEVILYLTQ